MTQYKKKSITIPEPILPGSIATVWIRCGKKNCPCRKDPGRRHGPYYQWSGIIEGKSTSRIIPPEMIRECEKRIENYQKLCNMLEGIKANAIKNAPWNSKPP